MRMNLVSIDNDLQIRGSWIIECESNVVEDAELAFFVEKQHPMAHWRRGERGENVVERVETSADRR